MQSGIGNNCFVRFFPPDKNHTAGIHDMGRVNNMGA